MDTKQWMVVLLVLAILLMLFVASLSYRKRHLPGAKTMIAIMIGAVCYASGYAFEILSSDLQAFKLSLQIEYLGIPFVSTLWLLQAIAVLLCGIMLYVSMYWRSMLNVRKQIAVLLVGAAAPFLCNMFFWYKRTSEAL